MTEKKKLINICLIGLMVAAILVIASINTLSMINTAEADIGDDLIVESTDTDTANVIKIKNILRYRNKFRNNNDYAVEKNIYKALGYSSEQINEMDEEDFEKLKNTDEIDFYTSDFYVKDTPVTRSDDNGDSSKVVDVIIAGPSAMAVHEMEALRKSMTFSMMIQRDASEDGSVGLVNKDDGSITNAPYFGVRVSFDLLWHNDYPATRYEDRLFVFTSTGAKSEEVTLKWNDSGEKQQVLTAFAPSGYYSYTFNLPNDGTIIGTHGEYVYEAIYGSLSFNFRVVYLHHTMASVGFDGHIDINSEIMDVDVDSLVTHAKYKTSIFTINAS